MRIPPVLRVAAVVGLLFGAVVCFVPRALAQPPGSASITTSQSQYRLGDLIDYCYQVPSEGTIVLAYSAADGTTAVLYNGGSAGTGGCQTTAVFGPPGQGCLRLTYPQRAGDVGTVQTCFQLVDLAPPPLLSPLAPPPLATLTISTDRTQYAAGESIRMCYSVPAPGAVTIIDLFADGAMQTVLSGFEDGLGRCQVGTVVPPAGTECLTLLYTAPGGVQTSTQTCFQVLG